MTWRIQFLQGMETVVDWAELEALVAPIYGSAWARPDKLPLRIMLRIYVMKHWFGYNAAEMEQALYAEGATALRRFAGLNGSFRVPGSSEILRFHQLLEQHGLTERIFAIVGGPPPEPRI